MFPKIGVPQNGWCIMKNSFKMDDLGVPLFLETPIWMVINQLVGFIRCFIPDRSARGGAGSFKR